MNMLPQITVFLFLLSIGKSPEALREFNRLRGEWKVVRIQEEGRAGDIHIWYDKKIVFALSQEQKKPTSAGIEFAAQLNVRRKPMAFEKGTLTLISSTTVSETSGKEGEAGETDEKSEKTLPLERKQMEHTYDAIYEVNGDTMKLLLRKNVQANTKRLTRFVTVPGDNCALLVLRRIKTGKVIPLPDKN